jgi:hypothetical protein
VFRTITTTTTAYYLFIDLSIYLSYFGFVFSSLVLGSWITCIRMPGLDMKDGTTYAIIYAPLLSTQKLTNFDPLSGNP